MRDPENRIKDRLDEMGVNYQKVEPGQEKADKLVDNPEYVPDEASQFKRVETVQPVDPETGVVEDTLQKYLIEGEYEVVHITRYRIQCPSCSHVLDDEDRPDHPIDCGEDDCTRATCYECNTVCMACDKVLCPIHAKGNGVKDEAYCWEHAVDVEQEQSFERELRRREQEHAERMNELDQEIRELQEAVKLVQQLGLFNQPEQEPRQEQSAGLPAHLAGIKELENKHR